MFFSRLTFHRKVEVVKKVLFQCKGRYSALGHFSFSNFSKLLLAEIFENKNNGWKE